MKKKPILLLIILSFSLFLSPFLSSANKSTDNNDYSVSHLVGVNVAIYNGSGAWSYTKPLIPLLLDWACCTYKNVSGQDIIEGCLENFDVLFWPGGDYVAYWGEMGLEGKAAVQEFVSNGGGYLGVCAGAYYACDYMVWMDDGDFPPPDYKVEGDELNLDLFEGVAWGPIFELAERPTPGYAMVQVNLNNDHAITRVLPESMQIFYAGGPYLVPYEETTSEITILGTYNLTGQNAIAATTFGEGRVFLISPHAELELDSYRDGYEPYPEIPDEGSDWPLLYKAIEWLAFESPEDITNLPFPFRFTYLVIIPLVYWFYKKKKKNSLSSY